MVNQIMPKTASLIMVSSPIMEQMMVNPIMKVKANMILMT